MAEYIKNKGILWKKYQGALIPENPPHVEIHLTSEEQKYLLKTSTALFLRWPSQFDMPHASAWWYVIKDSFDGMDELSRKTRSKVRRALKRQQVRKVSHEFVAEHGYEVYNNAFTQYDTYLKPLSEKEFTQYIQSLDESQWAFFAVFDNESGVMTAYSQNFVCDETAEYKIIKLHPAYLKNYASYALIYTMNEYYLTEKKCKYVNDGSRAIAHQTKVQDFLIHKMKFRRAYCKLNVKYKPWVRVFDYDFFPFRGVFKSFRCNGCKKINVLMRQEEIRRNSSAL
ncbi:MAG: hypothetical protein PF590_07315 [Candidatus Delongbacteria bacterium]|jgi:hypothetical protein|nr:hypothetical protein [Candidatus Delongbacteria bacterium]